MTDDNQLLTQILEVLDDPAVPEDQLPFADDLWQEVRSTVHARSRQTPAAVLVAKANDAPTDPAPGKGRAAIWVATAAAAAVIAAVAWFGSFGTSTVDTATETLTVPSEACSRYVGSGESVADLLAIGDKTVADLDVAVDALTLLRSDLAASGLYEPSELDVFDIAVGAIQQATLELQAGQPERMERSIANAELTLSQLPVRGLSAGQAPQLCVSDR